MEGKWPDCWLFSILFSVSFPHLFIIMSGSNAKSSVPVHKFTWESSMFLCLVEFFGHVYWVWLKTQPSIDWSNPCVLVNRFFHINTHTRTHTLCPHSIIYTDRWFYYFSLYISNRESFGCVADLIKTNWMCASDSATNVKQFIKRKTKRYLLDAL